MRSHLIRHFSAFCVLALLFFPIGSIGTASAASLATLHTFGTNPDGVAPIGLLRAANGFFYAVTAHGGLHGRGAITVSVDGTNFMPLYSFSGLDGSHPNAGLIQGRDGFLYGTTYEGGLGDNGVVFKIGADGTGFTVLHSFHSTDGLTPEASLVQASNGCLYGTTVGNIYNTSTIFRVGTDGNGFATIHSFAGNDGITPSGSLIQGYDGMLYGTANAGGVHGSGTIFAVGVDGNGFVVIHSFSGSDGTGPSAALIQASNGFLYGTTGGGGINGFGTIFGIGTNGAGFAVLHNFNSTDGSYLTQPLVQGSNGDLYGVASGGGTNNAGTIFSIGTDGTGFAILYSFTDGFQPQGLLFDPANNFFYGVVPYGGTHSNGYVYQINPSGTKFNELYSFSATNHIGESSSLGQATNGYLYGTIDSGGLYGLGGVFKISATGSDFSLIYSFSGLDGRNPEGSLIQGRDGFLYGTTSQGGASDQSGTVSYNTGYGTVFKIGADGTGFQLLHSFQYTDGSYPASTLVQTDNGSLYGTANGGPNDTGTLFTISTDGTAFATLHNFNVTDGNRPQSTTPILFENGLLYSTTANGGINGAGTIFRLGTDGTSIVTLYSFGSLDGIEPGISLVPDGNGGLYGTRIDSSPYTSGTIFRFGTDGTGFATLHTFTTYSLNGPDGRNPQGLMLAKDGLLYGATYSGGSNDNGTIYKISPDGSGFATVHQFQGTDGARPYAAMIQGQDGSLYGTTGGQSGTIAQTETLFRLNLGTPSTHVLWLKTNGQLSVWNQEASTGEEISREYGPFSGWTPVSLADGLDGRQRILWNHTSGQISLWILDNVSGSFTNAEYGPFAGWTANAVSVSADNRTHILWTNPNGTASVWNLDMDAETYTSHNFGPFAGWSAVGIADGPDGLTRVLWNNSDGRASVWNLDNDAGTATHTVFGPYPGWTARSLTVAQDNTVHLLWDNADGRASFWNLNNAAGTFTQNTFGPYPGWTAQGVGDGPDGRTRVAWDNTDGRLSLWDLDNTAGAFTQFTYGPYLGWSALNVSVGF